MGGEYSQRDENKSKLNSMHSNAKLIFLGLYVSWGQTFSPYFSSAPQTKCCFELLILRSFCSIRKK